MRRVLAAALAVAALGCAAPRGARAADVTPMLDLRLLGGQYFFGRERSDVSGSASLLFAPAVSVDDRWSVLPQLCSSFEGSKAVVDPVGQGTVLAQQMEHRLSARAVYETPSGRWRLKPFVAGSYALLKETRDERWGKGLFDHWQWDAGGEAEYVYREPFALRARASWFDTRFPNYVALESKTEAQGPGLARPGAGAYPLDSHSVAAEAEFEAPAGERLVAEGRLSLVYSRYPQQRVVAATGLLSSSAREDLVTRWTASVKLPLDLSADLRAVGGVSLGYAFDGSTQNGYDAAQGLFLPLAENWGEWKGGPWAKVYLGPLRRPATITASAELSARRWPHRPAQGETGLYDGGPMRQRTWTGQAGVSYPLGDRFAVSASLQWARAVSNQRYQQLYRYDYSATTYLFGFSYSY